MFLILYLNDYYLEAERMKRKKIKEETTKADFQEGFSHSRKNKNNPPPRKPKQK